MFDKSELDRNEPQKEKVQIKITLPNVKTYKKHANAFKTVAEQSGGNMSVKML